MLAINQQAWLEYQPLGVVGVIGPWNYPVFTPMGSIAYALAAGNAVVFKPSEFTPAIGAVARADVRRGRARAARPAAASPASGETGRRARAQRGRQDRRSPGSTATAKKVMAACAETLTPVLIECGGKDAMIVDADADLDAAADAAAWGGVANGGQTCVGVERVYVVESVYDEFVEILQAKLDGVRAGADADARRTARSPCPARSTSSGATSTTPSSAAARPLVGGADSVGGAVRRADRAHRRARGLPGGRRGDLRPDHRGQPGARRATRRSTGPTRRRTGWAAPSSPRSAGWSSRGGCARA